MFGWFFFLCFPYEQKCSAFKIYSICNICTEAANRDSGALYFMVL